MECRICMYITFVNEHIKTYCLYSVVDRHDLERPGKNRILRPPHDQISCNSGISKIQQKNYLNLEGASTFVKKKYKFNITPI